MKLSDKWFTALSENDNGDLVAIYGRDELTEFMQSGKLKERVEITWKYIPAEQGMPSDAEAERMEAVEVALRKAMEKTSWRSRPVFIPVVEKRSGFIIRELSGCLVNG